MENASKALIMAGGMLLAMMLLAMIVYVGTSMGDMAESQDRKVATEQIEEFNQTYLAYDKNRMYGIDVITVVNKAINHNKTIEATETDPYYINVIVKTKSDFKTTGVVIDNSYPSDHEEHEKDLSSDKIKQIMGIGEITVALSINSDGYNLGNWSSDGTLKMNNGIIKFFEQYKEDKVQREGNKVYYIYSALTNFKKAVFTCESMEDTSKDGRIDTIVFSQVS